MANVKTHFYENQSVFPVNFHYLVKDNPTNNDEYFYILEKVIPEFDRTYRRWISKNFYPRDKAVKLLSEKCNITPYEVTRSTDLSFVRLFSLQNINPERIVYSANDKQDQDLPKVKVTLDQKMISHGYAIKLEELDVQNATNNAFSSGYVFVSTLAKKRFMDEYWKLFLFYDKQLEQPTFYWVKKDETKGTVKNICLSKNKVTIDHIISVFEKGRFIRIGMVDSIRYEM